MNDKPRLAVVAGTFDTKGTELGFMAQKLRQHGLHVITVDLATSRKASEADVKPAEIAACHPAGSAAVFSNDRGQSVTAMAEAFARWIDGRHGIAGIIAAGGSGGTTLATAGMRRLPVGVPKVMVSTVASGDVGAYVGPSDIMMMYSVADVQGINPITGKVLGNAANALAGMMTALPSQPSSQKSRPAIGFTMFGVTTPCIQALQKNIEPDFDCLVFHATGTGGRSMEKLIDSKLIQAVMDITTTEVADMIVGGILAAGEDRFGAMIRTRIPFVGSVGALDMVNFGPRNTVPEKFAARNFVVHNANVTLMRTTPDENTRIGGWIGARLNEMEGEVRFLLPEGGVSMLDAPGKPFHDPEADKALFDALERTVVQTPRRKIERVPGNINDQRFIDAAFAAFVAIAPNLRRAR